MKSKFKAALYKHLDLCAATDIQRCYGNQAIYVIPATLAAYEAQVEAMAKGLWDSKLALHQFGLWEDTPERHRDRAKGMVRDGLAALGIKKPTKGNE